MTGVVPVNPRIQFFSSAGAPLVNGTVDVYLAGTTTRSNTWQDVAQSTLNTNPIVLNSRGEGTVYLDPSLTYKFVLKNSGGVEQYTSDNISGAGALTALTFLQAGTDAVARAAQDKMREVVSVDDFFLAGMADDTLALQRAITAVGSGGVVNLNRNCTISSATVAVQVSAQNVTISGGKKRATLTYTGAGVAIALGTDDGLSLDAANYNGVAQGFTLRNVFLTCANDGTAGKPRTALLNSISGRYFGTGTYGIQDWRGGYTKFVDCHVEGFQYGYWGVQADMNSSRNLTLGYNNVAVFLGPRCDQALFEHVWSFGNDIVFQVQGSKHFRVTHWTTDTDGSGSTSPVQINASSPALNARYATTREVGDIEFDQPWLEQLGSLGSTNPGYNVDAIFKLCVGDAVRSGGITINNPIVLTYDQADATKPHFHYLVRCGHLASVTVNECSSARNNVPWTSVKAIFAVDVSPASTPTLYFSDADALYGSRLIENYNASSCLVQFRTNGFGNTYLANSLGGTGAVLMGGLGLQRKLAHNNVPDATGANLGDITLSRIFSGGTLGWVYDGGSHNVIQVRALAGDRGDQDVTITPESDSTEQQFNTALTADRTLVLAAPATTNTKSHWFRVTRAAAGAFNLNVRNLSGGGSLVKAMPTGSWAEFVYNGSAWFLRAYGAL